MSEVRTWLVGIGLGQYADAFEANDIEMDLLKEVDDQTLTGCGKTPGHRSMTQQSNLGDLFRESLLRSGLTRRINLAAPLCQNRFSAAC